jgi:hypothetical protein
MPEADMNSIEKENFHTMVKPLTWYLCSLTGAVGPWSNACLGILEDSRDGYEKNFVEHKWVGMG